MRETTDERMAVAPHTTQRAPGAALTAIAVVIALLLGGILTVLIGLYQRVDQDLAVMKEDMATAVDDLAVLKVEMATAVDDLAVLKVEMATAVDDLAVVARNAQADLDDCGPGAARNRAGDCIIG